MNFRPLSLIAALALVASPALAQQKPLVSMSGQTRQLPPATTLGTQPSTTTAASINIPQGTAPSAPNNGDIWVTSDGIFSRVNGATQGPLISTVTTANLTGSGSNSLTPTFWQNWDSLIPSGDAYDKIPSPLTVNLGYGYNAPATGTAIGVQANLDVKRIGAATTGTNEFAAYYGYVRANQSIAPLPSGQNWWTTDFIIQSPYAPLAADRPNYVVGVSQHIFNLSNGAATIDASHAGSFGMTVVANPLDNASLTASGAPTTAPTYPVSAMYQAAGWAGQNTTVDGYDVNAQPAAVYAFRAGGGGGSVYIPNTARSYFQIGYGCYDWTDVCLDIAARNPKGSGPGIRNIYSTELGGSGMTGSFVPLLIKNNSSGNFATIQYGEGTASYLAGRDIGNTGADNWGVYSSTLAGYPLVLTPTTAQFGTPVQLPAKTFASLPACAGGTAGTTAYIVDASVPITTWHQQVTAGGGSNKAFITCNGSTWNAFSY